MLASNSADSPATSTADTAMTVPQQPAPAAAPPAEAPAYNHQELEDLVNMIVSSPEFKDAFDFSSPSMDPEQYLTSPMPALGHDFDEPSPKETPLNDLLSTPLFENTDSPLLTDQHDFDMSGGDPLFASYTMPLFPDTVSKPLPATKPQVDFDGLLAFSPDNQPLDSFSSSVYSPASRQSSLAPQTPVVGSAPTKPATRRRSNATGTRKGITPESLVPLDAPTQPRKYATPSATSRKELPAVFARKRARSQAFDEEEDELQEAPPGPNATEREQIEWKRRQNTLAARKSRKRKLEYQQKLESDVERLTQERDNWKTRALTLQSLLVSHGIRFNEFQD
ncbi:hypothetical protein CC1G_05406 [Coprinopsis cinerea okayama7|uniref:BZIP domain-containing protein n=1 Tax=Coprinopsis cinerea (strain Okayama-7 / 130 / ATCC MYA-4618 / FGSC 9003) TaxID=240176 RepID=A8NQ01_COPC7|nr:hypothetical protein CC1G_05406 [Coprinopsis cinerea okayama7\|eukprot:XP_001835444.1 hypothetical protein CC1G_05406 [Coprinopsis cinerea okayama7\